MGNAGAKLKSSTIPTINFVFKSEIILSLLAINICAGLHPKKMNKI
jgi:hypothetical protein